MSTLAYDIARCPGTTAPLCTTCRRREPGRPEWQVTIAPAWTLQGCANYIGPEQQRIDPEQARANHIQRRDAHLVEARDRALLPPSMTGGN